MRKTTLLLVFVVLLSGFGLVSASDPDITSMYAVPNNPYAGAQFNIYVRAEDNDGIDRIQFYDDGHYVDVEYCGGDTCSAYFTVYEETSGYHTYKVRVYDNDDNLEVRSLPVYVRYSGYYPYGRCGDGVCSGGETCSSCPTDCGPCNYCGNGVCSGGETCSSCPTDCGPCNYCGNGVCTSSESCSTCPQDCGSCVIVPEKPVYTCSQRGGECCDYGGTGAIDGASDCPSTCFSQCNAAPGAPSAEKTGGVTGAVVSADSLSLAAVVALLIILVLLIAILFRR